MANDGSIKIGVNVDEAGAKTGLTRLEGLVAASAKVIGAAVVAVGTAIGTGIGKIAGAGIAFNKEVEMYEASFATMLGSAEKADAMLGNLREFAAKTPFELGDLAKGAQTLMQFGIAGEDVEDTLHMLGDIAQGNTEKFNGLAVVFGQVASAGRMNGQDLMQMINQGFNPLNVIAEQTGESMESLRDRMAKGEISFEMVAEAMRTATDEGGMFFNAMENQSRTLEGQISTLADGFNMFAGEAMASVSAGLTDSVLPALNSVVDSFTALIMGQEGATAAIQVGANDLVNAIVDMVSGVTATVSDSDKMQKSGK